MKKELEDKIVRLQQLEKEVRELRVEVTCEVEEQYKDKIDKRVKIVGQKGWSTGIVRRVKADIHSNNTVVMMCQVVSEANYNCVWKPFKDLQFLDEKEKKDFNLHDSINKKQ